MKNSILFLLFLMYTTLAMAQDHNKPHLFHTDSTWSKEIIPFPISFAPEIKWKGYEDAQFTPGWGKPESPEFWSYLFAWNIYEEKTFTAAELERFIQKYFDGLMEAVNKDRDFTVPNTTALFVQKDSLPKTNYVGKVKVYDSFRTKKLITLNILAHSHMCKKHQKTVLVFKFSPQEFGHKVWSTLKEVTLRDDVCEL